MARGRKKATEEQTFSGMPKFVTVQLSVEDKDDFRSQSFTAEGVVQGLVGAIAAGHRVGLSFNGENQSYVASLTGRDDGCKNIGLCLTAFAGDALLALALVLYKHEVLCEGDWASGSGGLEDDIG